MIQNTKAAKEILEKERTKEELERKLKAIKAELTADAKGEKELTPAEHHQLTRAHDDTLDQIYQLEGIEVLWTLDYGDVPVERDKREKNRFIDLIETTNGDYYEIYTNWDQEFIAVPDDPEDY